MQPDRLSACRARVRAAIAALLITATTSAAHADAKFSLEGNFVDPSDTRDINFNLSSTVTSAQTMRFETHHWAGGTNHAGDTIPGGSFDAVLEVFDPGLSSIAVDSEIIFPGDLDARISFTQGNTPLPASVPAGDYRLELRVFPNEPILDGHWAVDLTGPNNVMELTLPQFLTANPGFADTTKITAVGAGSTAHRAGALFLGFVNGGNTSLNAIQGGQIIVTAQTEIARTIGSTASITVKDNLSDFDTTALYIGGSNTTAGGTGTFTMGFGGNHVAEVHGPTKVWPGGTLNITGGFFLTDGLDLTMPGATLSHTDGVLGVGGGAFEPPAGAAYTIEGAGNPDLRFATSGTWTHNHPITVGDTAPGTLSVFVGGTVMANAGLRVAASAGSDGSLVHVTGTGGALTTTQLDIGGNGVAAGGTGSLLVEQNGTVNVTSAPTKVWNDSTLTVGSVSSGGAASFTTAGLDLTAPGATLNHFSGTLTINAGTLDAPATTFDINGTGNPHLVITAAGQWTDSGSELRVGSTQSGELTISDGGTAHSPSATIADDTGSTGTVNVTGPNAQWTVDGNLVVGDFGDGTLHITSDPSGPATVNALADTIIGTVQFAPSTNTGVINVSGPNSLLSAANDLIVGLAGQGTLNITDGGRVEASNTNITSSQSGNGEISLSGTDSTLSTGILDVGGIGTNLGGIASVFINSGGSVTVDTNRTKVWNDDVIVLFHDNPALPGPALTTKGLDLTAPGAVLVHDGGTVTINGGSFLTTDDPYTIDAADNPHLIITGALWNPQELIVGNDSAGTLTVGAGGNVGTAKATSIAAEPGSSGELTVTGAGAAFTAPAIDVGGYTLTASPGGTAALNIRDGGTVTTPLTTVWPDATLDIDGGTLTTDRLQPLPGSLLRLAGGGTLTLPDTNNASVPAPTIVLWDTGTLRFTGPAGATLGNNILPHATSLNTGQHLDVTSTLTVALGQILALAPGASLQTGALQLNGGTIIAPTLDIDDIGSLTGTGSVLAAITSYAAADITLTGPLTLGDPSSTAGFNFAGSINAGANQLVLLDADLASLGVATTLDAGGSINAPNGTQLPVAAMLSVTGPATIDGAFQNDGSVDVAAGQTLTFNDPVNGGGGFPGLGEVIFNQGYFPGTSPGLVHFAGDVTFTDAAELVLELAGLTPGTQHDQLDIAGTLNAAGTLTITLLDNYQPANGDTFTLLAAAQTLGQFTTLNLPTLNHGLTLDTSALLTTGQITITPEPDTLALLTLPALLIGRRRKHTTSPTTPGVPLAACPPVLPPAPPATPLVSVCHTNTDKQVCQHHPTRITHARVPLLARQAVSRPRPPVPHRTATPTALITALNLILTACIAAPAVADTTWNNITGNRVWSDPTNWSAGEPNFFSGKAIFPSPIPGGNGNIILNAGEFTGELVFESGGYGLQSGGALNVVSGNITVTTGNSGIFSPIDSDLANGLTKLGFGVLNLQGNNVYSGPTTVSQGLLDISGFDERIPDPSVVTVNGGTQLRFFVGAGAETIGGLAGSGTVVFANDTGGTALTIGNNNSIQDTTFSGNIVEGFGGTGSLTKDGPRVVTLSGTNTYSGNTSVQQGTLRIQGPTNSLPDSTFVGILSGATLQIDATTETVQGVLGTGTVNLTGTAATLNLNATLGAPTFDGAFTGTGTVNKTGNFQMDIGGVSNIPNGTFNLQDGLLLMDAGSLTVKKFTISPGATFTQPDGRLRVTGAGGSFEPIPNQPYNVQGFNGAILEIADGASWTHAPTSNDIPVTVGDTQQGQLNVLDFVPGSSPPTAVRIMDDLNIGANPGSAGSSVLVHGDDASLTADFLYIGGVWNSPGTPATLTIQADGKAEIFGFAASATSTTIWDNSTLAISSGSLTTKGLDFTAPGAALNHTGGKVTIDNGTLVSNSNTHTLGSSLNPHLEITGPSARFNLGGNGAAGVLNVNNGELTIADQAVVSLVPSTSPPNFFTQINIAAANTDTGKITVTGTDSTLRDASTLRVGIAGNGTLNIEDGGTVGTGGGSFAQDNNSVANVTIKGDGSRLTLGHDFQIGRLGTTEVMIQNGGTLDVLDPAAISTQVGSDTTITVTGTNALFQAHKIDLGGEFGNPRGAATLNIQPGASVLVTDDRTKVFDNDTINITGGDLTTKGLDLTSPGATLNHSGGKITVNGNTLQAPAGEFAVNGPDNPHLELTGNATTWTHTDTVTVGDTLPDDGLTAGNNAGNNAGDDTDNIADNAAAATTPGSGQLTISSGADVTLSGTPALVIGKGATPGGSPSTGSVTVTNAGSTLDLGANQLTVGESGHGTLNITDNATLTNGRSILADQPDSTATVTVDNATWNEGLGASSLGSQGTATLNITNGGVVNSDDGASIGVLAGSQGHVTVSGNSSRWDLNSGILAGLGGHGTVTVEQGGLVQINAGGTLIAGFDGAVGHVTVSGTDPGTNAPSTYNTPLLNVGNTGTTGNGTLTIGTGGIVNVTDTTQPSFLWENARVDVTGGTFNTTGGLQLHPDSLLTLTDNGTIDVINSDNTSGPNAAFLWTSGTLIFGDDADLATTLLPAVTSISDGRKLIVEGELTVDAGQALTIAPAGEVVASVVTLNGGAIAAHNITLGDTGFTSQLVADPLTTNPTDNALPVGITTFGRLVGQGTVLANISHDGIDFGALIVATGPLTLGNAASTTGFDYTGHLNILSSPVTLLDADLAILGITTTIESGGSLTTINGALLNPGNNLNANPVDPLLAQDLSSSLTADTLADPPQHTINGPFTNNGLVNVAAGESLTFTDNVTGSGSFPRAGHVVFNQTYTPGPNPQVAVFGGDLTFGQFAELDITILGPNPGEHHLIAVTGAVALDGTLDIHLDNGFDATIIPSDQFIIMTFATNNGGTMFDTVEHNPLHTQIPGLSFTPTYNPTNLTITATALNGDADLDGDVDLEDLVTLAANFDTTVTARDWRLANFDFDTDVDADDLNLMAANFTGNPDTLQSFAAALGVPLTQTPEPTTAATLLALAAPALLTRRRWARSKAPTKPAPAPENP